MTQNDCQCHLVLIIEFFNQFFNFLITLLIFKIECFMLEIDKLSKHFVELQISNV